jgi:hypothetical protein
VKPCKVTFWLAFTNKPLVFSNFRKYKNMKRIILAAVVLVSMSLPAFAQMPEFEPEVKRVAIFKNGYAFTYREGEATTIDGWTYTTRTPIGVLGTVWGYTTLPNSKVVQLLASQSDKSGTERVSNVVETLLANEGARIRFTDNYNSNKLYEGTYEIISRNRNFAVSPDGGAQEVTIALKTETGVMFFPVSLIRNIEIIGQPKYDKPRTTRETRLSLKIDGVKDGQKLNVGIAALERGVRWIPAYRVEVKGEPIKEAKLELEAMLVNDLADMKNTDVYFVVGVPSFLFQDEVSPLSLNAAFAGVSTAFRRDQGQNLSNAIMSQRATQEVVMDTDDISPTSPDEEKSASFSAEQLYLYQANQVSLRKGERMSQRLFSLTVPCTEVFEWTIDDSNQPETNYARAAPISQPLNNRVWYGLRLKNTTGMPWTTAPAISFRDWKPLGQNLMTFTPTGGENILRVTPATEVIGSHVLEEKSREPKQLRFSGSTYDYDLVTVEGTIKLKNVKKTPVELVLTRNVTGDVILAGDAGKVSRQGFNLQAVNPNSTIKWNINLPNGEKEIKYTYKIFVRR